MAYIAAADLRERTRKPWAADILLTEGDASDAELDLIIAQVAAQVELDLDDDFDPPSPDNDETINIDGAGGTRLHLPRRCRSITTLSTRSESTFTTQSSSTYYHRKSLNAAGTAMVEGRRFDYLEVQSGFTLAGWPYGTEAVRIVGKFGWAAVPDDIKRLVALRVYDLVRAKADPLTQITQRVTVDATLVLGESREMADIVNRYSRKVVYVG